MNPIDDNLHAPDDERFDLLADGELPEPERRRLLSELDHVPGGWRRCALAFLEAQSWKQGMRSVRRESAGAPHAARARPMRRRGFPGGPFGTLVAMAASFTIALGLGVAIQDFRQPAFQAGPSPVELAGGPKQPEPAAPKAVNPETPAATQAPLAPNVPASLGDAWRLVSLPVGLGPDGTEPIRVPARRRDRVDEQCFNEFAPTIPAELLDALKREGHQLRWSRQLVPFRMKDGQQLVVPLEQVELHDVGNPVYH